MKYVRSSRPAYCIALGICELERTSKHAYIFLSLVLLYGDISLKKEHICVLATTHVYISVSLLPHTCIYLCPCYHTRVYICVLATTHVYISVSLLHVPHTCIYLCPCYHTRLCICVLATTHVYISVSLLPHTCMYLCPCYHTRVYRMQICKYTNPSNHATQVEEKNSTIP